MKQPEAARLAGVQASLLGVRCSEKPRLLWISHSLGGGVERHLDELQEVLKARALPLRLQPGCVPGRYNLSVPLIGPEGGQSGPVRLGFNWPQDRQRLFAWLEWLGISRIHVHHLSGFSGELVREIMALGLPLDLTLHDHAILDQGRNASCLAQITQEVARAARRVIAPSQAVAATVAKALPDLSIQVHSHPDAEHDSPYPSPSVVPLAEGEAMRVLCLGTFTPEKGAMVLAAVARLAARRGEKVEFILLGESLYPLPGSVRQLGHYLDQSLSGRLEQLKPHVLWLPAQVPETWSYTLSAGLQAGLPIVASDIGALPERLQGRPLTALIAADSTPPTWLQALLTMRQALLLRPAQSHWPQRAKPAYYSAGDYLQSIGPERLAADVLPVGLSVALVLGMAPAGWRERLLGWLTRCMRKMPLLGHLLANTGVRQRLKRLLLRQ